MADSRALERTPWSDQVKISPCALRPWVQLVLPYNNVMWNWNWNAPNLHRLHDPWAFEIVIRQHLARWNEIDIDLVHSRRHVLMVAAEKYGAWVLISVVRAGQP